MSKETQELAREVLLLSRNTLLVNLRFLDAALNEFELEPGPLEMPDGSYAVIPIGTDGKKLYYEPRQVLQRYYAEKERVVRDYLHLVMHCVFRHMYVHSLIDQPLWDLACDIAAEEVINGLCLPCVTSGRQREQQKTIEDLRKEIKQITAEKVYRWYQDHPPGNLSVLAEQFRGDDHTPWYLPRTLASQADSSETTQEVPVSMEAIWREIAQRMQIDLETFSKMRGDRAGNLTQNLREVNRERYDYTEFLRKFAVRGRS